MKKGDKLKIDKWNKNDGKGNGTDKSARILSCYNTDNTEELSKTLMRNSIVADNVHHKTNNNMSIDITSATSTTNNDDT